MLVSNAACNPVLLDVRVGASRRSGSGGGGSISSVAQMGGDIASSDTTYGWGFKPVLELDVRAAAAAAAAVGAEELTGMPRASDQSHDR
jgi:hypothetical protein